MPAEYRDRLIRLALLVTESVRIYGIAAVPALLIGEASSVLAWPVVAGILALAMFMGWLTQGVRGDRTTLAILQALVGLPVMYLATAARTIGGTPGLDLDWPVRLAGFDLPGSVGPGIVFSLALALVLWRRGLSLSASGTPAETLRGVFRSGVVVLALLLLVEVWQDRDAGAWFLLVPFFAAGLGGLAVSELAPAAGLARGASFWGRLIAGAVAALLSIGVLSAVLGVLYGGAPLRVVGRGLGLVLEAGILLVSLPLGLLAMVFTAFLVWLKGLIGTEPQPLNVPEVPAAEPSGIPEATMNEGAAHPLIDLIFDLLRYPLLLLLVIGITLFLIYGFRRITGRRQRVRVSSRESIRGDASAASDLASLLRRLLPAFMRRQKDAERKRLYPAGQPGLTDVFLLYFRYLRAAVRRGHRPHESRTPNEARRGLADALPGAPVDLMTERFNAACYGNEPSSEDVVRRLRDGLRRFDRGGSGDAATGD